MTKPEQGPKNAPADLEVPLPAWVESVNPNNLGPCPKCGDGKLVAAISEDGSAWEADVCDECEAKWFHSPPKLPPVVAKPEQGPEPASPLPFRACKPCVEGDHHPCGIIWAADGETVLCVVTDDPSDVRRTREQRRQDMRYIVHACNAHQRMTSECARLVALVLELEQRLAADAAERDALQDRIDHRPNMQCVFCGHVERLDGSATSQVNQTAAHMLTCQLHPMRQVEDQRDWLAVCHARLRGKVVRISADRNAKRARVRELSAAVVRQISDREALELVIAARDDEIAKLNGRICLLKIGPIA